jgi:hypothetical protein
VESPPDLPEHVPGLGYYNVWWNQGHSRKIVEFMGLFGYYHVWPLSSIFLLTLKTMGSFEVSYF